MNRRDFTTLSVLGALASILPFAASADGSLVVNFDLVEHEQGVTVSGEVHNSSDQPVELLAEEDGLAGSTNLLVQGELVRTWRDGPSMRSRAGPGRSWVVLAPGQSRKVGVFTVPPGIQPSEAVTTLQSREGAIELKGSLKNAPRPNS